MDFRKSLDLARLPSSSLQAKSKVTPGEAAAAAKGRFLGLSTT